MIAHPFYPLAFAAGILLLITPNLSHASAPRCESIGWKIQVEWDSPVGMKKAPLPAQWSKDDTGYLNLIVQPPASAPVHASQAQITFTGRKKSASNRTVLLTTARPDGSYVLLDFIEALGSKKNWPGKLLISIRSTPKSPLLCTQEMRVHVAD